MPIITDEMKTALIADAIVGREHEMAAYQINIDSYISMLADLPQDNWPAELTKYKGIDPSEIDPGVDLETATTIGDYQWRDRLHLLLRTENIEMAKVRRFKVALEGRLDAKNKDRDLEAAVKRRNVEMAAAKRP